MISVCMATYNGEKYIEEQLKSILSQLGENDEVIVSDDSSTDNTLAIVESFNDVRIKIFPNNKFHSPIFNFENALKQATGDYIFLSDQDDIWKSDKIRVMLSYLTHYSLVVSDCFIVDKDGNLVKKSYFGKKIPRSGIIKNIVHNNYLGCCMAFKKEILEIALPFPRKIAMHDIWLGLCASLFYSTFFIPNKLIYYRRHETNASPTSENSNLPWIYRISYRLYFVFQLIKRKIVY